MILSSGFRALGFHWFHASTDCFNEMHEHCLNQAVLPIDIPTFALVATKDVYWHKKSLKDITSFLDSFFTENYPFYKPESHLRVLRPDNVAELGEMIRRYLPNQKQKRD